MNKKVLAIVGLAAVIAVSTGAITLSGSGGHIRGADGDPVNTDTVSTDTGADDVIQDDATPTEYNDVQDSSENDISTENTGNDIYGYADDIVSVESYNIARIIDHTTGDECTAREVFGKLYYYCYLAFKSDNTFELCLNPVADEIRKGKYAVYGDVISVEYEDGVGSEYTVISDNNGGIDYIIVNYGDYDVYFG